MVSQAADIGFGMLRSFNRKDADAVNAAHGGQK